MLAETIIFQSIAFLFWLNMKSKTFAAAHLNNFSIQFQILFTQKTPPKWGMDFMRRIFRLEQSVKSSGYCYWPWWHS